MCGAANRKSGKRKVARAPEQKWAILDPGDLMSAVSRHGMLELAAWKRGSVFWRVRKGILSESVRERVKFE